MAQKVVTPLLMLLIAAPLLCQEVEIESAATATSTTAEVLNLSKTTTGTPANGLGAGIRFELEDAGGAEEQAVIDGALEDNTNGAEVASLILRVNQAGTITDALRVDGTAGRVGIGDGGTNPSALVEVSSSIQGVSVRVHASAAGSTARLVLECPDLPLIRMYGTGTEYARLLYSPGNNAMRLTGYNGTGLGVKIGMDDGTDDIDGDGVWTNNAFGPSEWVMGQAQAGEVLCATGTAVDEDGKLRARVEPCTHENCRRVVGVAIPEDESVIHGNPSFAYKDTIDDGAGWWGPWRKNHVGMELTGFRHVRVVGPVEVGDLLVASGVPGHARAQRAGDRGDLVGVATQSHGRPGDDTARGEVWTRVHLQRVTDLSTHEDRLERRSQSLTARVQRLEAMFDRVEAHLDP